MSEASRVWRVQVDGVEREIEVDHSAMTNKIVVKLDGAVVDETRLWFTSKDVQFDVGARRAVVEVEYAYGGFGVRSELHVDGRYVEPLAR